MAASTLDEVDVDVHHLGHVVVIYFFWYFVFVVCFFITIVMFVFSHLLDGFVAIVDKLERLLNLRILTEGTKA